jgi:hypothetical protein
MKRKTKNKRLLLSKETVRSLQPIRLRRVVGGLCADTTGGFDGGGGGTGDPSVDPGSGGGSIVTIDPGSNGKSVATTTQCATHACGLM